MSKRICRVCNKIYNSNDPGRMTVCFQCCPPARCELEQEEPADDGGNVHDYTCDCEYCKPDYVKLAVKHLAMVRKMIRKLLGECNFHTRGFAEALMAERDRLIDDDAAYADAKEILDSIGLKD